MTTDEGALRLEDARGTRAERLLGDELLVEAFETIRAAYVAAWESTPVRDVEGRERIWAHLQALGKVRGHLETVAATGKMARAQLAELETGKKPFLRW